MSALNKIRNADRAGELLRDAAPAIAAPEGLHEDIMLSVRAVSSLPRERARRLRALWIPAVSFAALAIVALFQLSRPAHDLQTLNAPAVALEQGELLAQNAPVTALSPLNEEMEKLKRDLNGAVQFVIASVP